MSKKFNRLTSIVEFICLVTTSLQINQTVAKAYTPTITPGEPLTIVVDNSGSMGRCAKFDPQAKKCIIHSEKPYKIDSVKDGIRRRLSQPDLATTRLGMIEFGNHRKYKTNKQDLCSAIKISVPTVENTQNRIINELDNIEANYDGISPIASAINRAAIEIEKQKPIPQSARILLISDGEPNCGDSSIVDENPCRIVDALSVSTIDFYIDIIGHRTDGKDTQFKECAAKYPDKVRYFPTNTIEELDEAVNKTIPTIQSTPEPTSSPKSTTVPTSGGEKPCKDSSNDWLNQIIVGLLGTILGAVASQVIKMLYGAWLEKKKVDKDLTVKVLDKQGNIIPDAKISLQSKNPPIFVHTDSEGIAYITIRTHTSTARIFIEATGYENFNRNINMDNKQGIEEFRLSQSTNP